MKLQICTYEGNIVTQTDFESPEGLGEIAQYITELKLLQEELLWLYVEFAKENKKT